MPDRSPLLEALRPSPEAFQRLDVLLRLGREANRPGTASDGSGSGAAGNSDSPAGTRSSEASARRGDAT